MSLALSTGPTLHAVGMNVEVGREVSNGFPRLEIGLSVSVTCRIQRRLDGNSEARSVCVCVCVCVQSLRVISQGFR